jgi:predicted molibdopterin-dependent oxidoreductase YjgC
MTITFEQAISMCCFCHAGCLIGVTLDGDQMVRAAGHRESPSFHGFCCTLGPGWRWARQCTF